MNGYPNNEERVILTITEIKREMDTLHFLIDHANARREELRSMGIPRSVETRDKRMLRGKFISRLNNEIEDYGYRLSMLECTLADMEG